MNSLLYTFTALLGAACLALPAFSAPAAALPATLKPEPHQRDPYDWNARHEAVKKRNRAVKPEYVMIGDSITHHWGGEPSGDSRKAGEASWEKLFGPHAVTNMGFGFDYVDNAYYRVQNGELAGISRGSSLFCWEPTIWATGRMLRRPVRTISRHLFAWCIRNAPLPKSCCWAFCPGGRKT